MELAQRNEVVYSDFKVGENLVRYLRNVDTIKADIGGFSYDRFNKPEYVKSGAQVTSNMNPAHFLSGLNTTIEMNSMHTVNGLTVTQLINKYYSSVSEFSINDKSEILRKIRDIGDLKELVVAIKPGEIIKLSKEACSKTHRKEGFGVSSVLWKVDKDGKFRTILVARAGDIGSHEGVRLNIEEYGEGFKTTSLDSIVDNNVDRGIIRFSRFGHIMPIEVSDSTNKYAMDGRYMYKVKDSLVEIIGEMGNDGVVYYDGKEIGDRTKVGKYLKANYQYFFKHNKYIMPYMVTESNKVKL